MGDMNVDIRQRDSELVKIAEQYGLFPVSTAQTVQSGKCLDAMFTTFPISLHGTVNLYFRITVQCGVPFLTAQVRYMVCAIGCVA